jgi:Tol biopolymer transport system component
VYSYTPPLPNVKGPGGLLPLPVTDVYMMNADGSGAKVLIDHGAPGVGYETPIWAADGRSLYVTYTELLMDGNIVRDEIVEVARVPAGGGPRQTLVPNGTQPTLSPDGRRLAFIVSQPEGQALAVADADGKGRLTLVPQGQLDAMAAPRFAPDGKRIVFSAVPPITAGAAPAQAGGMPRVLAHGLPMDVYVVGADGSGLRRLTELGEDSPAAAWSPDAQRLAVVAGGGIYLLRADGSGLLVLDRRGGHGSIDWRRAPGG